MRLWVPSSVLGPWAIGLLSVLTACGEPGDPDVPRDVFVARDSLGVLIAETRGGEARAALPWRVDPAPSLEIGADEGAPPEYLFSGIAGVRVLDDGRLIVLDRLSREVRLYDRDGSFVTHYGGAGNGPGEFQSPQLLPTVSGPAVVWDGRLVRFTELAPDGTVDVWSGQFRPGNPVGITGSHLLWRSSEPFDPVANTIAGPRVSPGSILEWLSIRTGVGDTVAVLPGVRQFLTYDLGVAGTTSTGASTGPMGVRLTVPYSVFPSATVGADGLFTHAGGAPEIHQYDSSGVLRRILRLVEPVQGVVEDAFLAAADAEAVTMARASGIEAAVIRDVFAEMPLPDTVPAFRSLLVDDLGWLWAETYAPPDEVANPRWIVFDGDGRGIGSVETPQDVEIHQIGADFLLGVSTDALGVEAVRLYSLTRQ